MVGLKVQKVDFICTAEISFTKMGVVFTCSPFRKQFPEALKAVNNTLKVHPGCLVAHQNKVRYYSTNTKIRIWPYKPTDG